MNIKKINDRYTFINQFIPTRNGFKHVSTLFDNGLEIGSTKVCYINRTWESYEYRTVMKKLASNLGLKELCDML